MEEDELLELLAGLQQMLGEVGLGSVVTAAREERRFDEVQSEVQAQVRDMSDASRAIDEMDKITRTLMGVAYSAMFIESRLDNELEVLSNEHDFPRQITFAPEGSDATDTVVDTEILDVAPWMITTIGDDQPRWTSQRVNALRDALTELREAVQLSAPPSGTGVSAEAIMMWASGEDT